MGYFWNIVHIGNYDLNAYVGYVVLVYVDILMEIST